MAQQTKRIPAGYHSVTPYLIVKGGLKALEWYRAAFNATEVFRMPMPDGRLAHGEIRIGDSMVMLADEFPEQDVKGPRTLGGSPVGLSIYTEDCDALFHQAVKAGAKIDRDLKNQFYGDRSGTVIDPFGHKWTIASHVEDVSPEEMERRMANMK